jgi:hypothetical protein
VTESGSRRAVAFLTALLALVPIALAGWRLAGHDRWITAPRHLQWLAADGRPLDDRGNREAEESCGADIHVKLVTDGSRAWAVCDAALVAFDLARGTARPAYPVPRDLKREWMEGLLPTEDGSRIAMVWRTVPPERLVLGVAGPEGWVRAPASLAGPGVDLRLLGMSWRDGALDVVADQGPAPTPTEGAPAAVIVSVLPDGTTRQRTVMPESLACGPYCRVAFAYRRPGARAWRFLVQRAGSDDWDVEENGAHEVAAAPHDLLLLGALGLTRTGILRDPMALRVELQPDGSFGALPAAPAAAGGAPLLSSFHRRDGGRVAVVPQWFLQGEGAFLHDLGGRAVRTRRVSVADEGAAIPGDAEYTAVADVTDPSHPVESYVATAHDCPSLSQGTFVPRGDGGWWLVDPAGCHVALDASLHRADPWGVVDHLRMRGSSYVAWREPSHAASLAWVLFGLPVALAAAIVVARIRRRPPRGPLLAAAWVYAASAAVLLVRVWPLLR